MPEPRSKCVVKADKAASIQLAGRPVAVVKTAKTKLSQKQSRPSATEVLSEAVREADRAPSATAGTASQKPKQNEKKTSRSSKKQSKASRKAAKAPRDRLSAAELDELRQERFGLLVKKTSDTYASHTRKWQWFLAHDDEGTELETPRTGDLTTADGRGNATRFLSWLEAGLPGWVSSGKGRKPSGVLTLSTLEGCHSALSAVYLEQARIYESSEEGRPALPATLLADHTYQCKYYNLKSKICMKGQRDTTVDPQRNTIKDTYDADDLQRMVDCLMENGSAETDRALAMALWAHSSVGRSDDVRLFYLADLITPQYIPAVGPSNCYVLPLVLKGGKTQRGGRPGYSGVIRSRDPALCPVRALAYHLVHRFTLDNHIFPDPADSDAWLTAAMFPGRQDPTNNITYDRQAQELRKLFEELGLDFSKLTHIFRVGGARHLDAAGVDDSVILRMGKWLRQAMYTHYLSFFKTEGLLAMGDWPFAQQKDFSQYWAERFELHVVQYLIDLVFPFLKDFSSSLEGMQVKPPSAKSMVDVLEYLGVVLVQDAVELLSEDKYTDHPLHKYLMADELFVSVLSSYKQLKAANAFEVRRPKTTKEIAVHNNQLLQQLFEKLDQMAHPAAAAAEVAGWSQAVFEQPQAPRMTPAEMEEAAAQQTEQLLQKIQSLEEQAADPAALDDPELFAVPNSGVAGAGVTTPSRSSKQQRRPAGLQQAPADLAAAAATRAAGAAAAAAAAAAGPNEQCSDDDEEDFQPAKRARRGGLPFTGRLAGLSSRAERSSTSSEAAGKCDEDMLDAGAATAAEELDSTVQLTPRTLFPGLKHKGGNSKPAATGIKEGGFSSKLAGTSSHVPNLATHLSRRHGIAEVGATINLPGHPIPVPLAALQAAGLMPAMQPSSVQPKQKQAAPAAAAAGAAGAASAAAGVAEAGATLQPDPHSICTEGRVSEASRHAAMASGLSAAAAGSGAVPSLPAGAHAAASNAAATAVAKTARHSKGSSKSMKLAQAAAQAAATAAVEAVQKAEASEQRSALPPFGDIKSVGHLWGLWKHGSSSSAAWEAQEEQGKAWRKGGKSARQRWFELQRVVKEVQRLAEEKHISPDRAAAVMDAERGDTKMPEYIKRKLPAMLEARKALHSAAAAAADAQATAAAAVAASQAAAAAAAAAVAADAAAHQAAAAVASRLH